LQAARVARAELEVARRGFVKESLMMQNFLRGERDPLDGLSPAQIEKFLADAGIDEMDPLEVGGAGSVDRPNNQCCWVC
jgi:hypothetical protein